MLILDLSRLILAYHWFPVVFLTCIYRYNISLYIIYTVTSSKASRKPFPRNHNSQAFPCFRFRLIICFHAKFFFKTRKFCTKKLIIEFYNLKSCKIDIDLKKYLLIQCNNEYRLLSYI